MEEKIEKGRKLLFALICILLGFEGLTLLLNLITLNFVSLLKGVVRIILSGLLYYYLFKGHGWAKMLTVFLMIAAIVLGIVQISLAENMIVLVAMTPVCIFYAIALLIFAFSSSVKAHWQNERNYREYGA